MTLAKLQGLKVQVLARLKAVWALLGVVLFYLQAVQAANPNHYVSGLIGILTVLGVHQLPNRD